MGFFAPLLLYHDNQAALTSCKVEAEFTHFSMALIYICKHCENLNMFCWKEPRKLREKHVSNSVMLLTFSLLSKVVWKKKKWLTIKAKLSHTEVLLKNIQREKKGGE